MPQYENLKKGKATQFKSGEKAAESGRKGGIASGIAKRKRKALSEMARLFADLEVNKASQKQLKEYGIAAEDMTHQMALVVAMFKEGESGNVKAAALLAEWLEPGKTDDKGSLDDILEAVKGVSDD